MGDWTDAYNRLRDARAEGKSTAEVETLAARELDKLVGEDVTST